VHEARFFLAILESDLGAPGLKIPEVRARADLQPFAAAGRPQLEVELDHGGERQVAGAHLDHAVGQLEGAQHRLGVGEQPPKLVHGVLGPHELDQLDLVELVAALDAASVAAGGHLLAAEAGGEGHVLDGQGGAVQDLFAVKIGDRHLGGGDEPEVLADVAIEVVAELGQVAGADQAVAADHEGRQNLAVAVLVGVQVEHEADERALQAGAPTLEHVETAARELHAAVEVDDAPARAEIPVRLRRKGEFAFLALLAHDAILALVLADRHRRVRQVGDLQQPLLQHRLAQGQVLEQLLVLLLERGALGLDLLARLR
jgi:hypothetical protein